MQYELSVGFGRSDITPRIGSNLYGYYPHPTADTVSDPLTVSAVACKSGDLTVILISATVCLFDNGLSDEIRKETAAAAGIRSDYVILAATHTHSGPCTAALAEHGEIDKIYCREILIPKTISAVQQAMCSIEPALIGVSSVFSEVGINRRQLGIDGSVILGQNPWGLFDPEMTVIAFRSPQGKPIANIIHYGAHNTAAGFINMITRDWSGFMCDVLECESGAPTIYFNGSEGDVGPRLTNGKTVGTMDKAVSRGGDINYARQLGSIAAADACKAYKQICEYRKEEISASYGNISLPCSDGDPLTFPQTLVKIGPLLFVPFPFELFSEISLRLRNAVNLPYVLAVGCANGCYSYLPSQDQLCRGGYEVHMFRTANSFKLTDDTDTNIIRENIRLAECLVKNNIKD